MRLLPSISCGSHAGRRINQNCLQFHLRYLSYANNLDNGVTDYYKRLLAYKIAFYFVAGVASLGVYVVVMRNYFRKLVNLKVELLLLLSATLLQTSLTVL